MPNVIQMLAFREKYESHYFLRNSVSNKELGLIVANFDKSHLQIEQAFRSAGLNPNVLQYLEGQKESHCILLFIDISCFSTKANKMTNSQLSQYLDRFYELTIPIIYEHGGEIEKIIGDGIICVFGKPFLKDEFAELLSTADKCAKSIIFQHEDSAFEVKVALHDGVIQYYKNKTTYWDYTIIGQPLTDLFRLESVAIANAVNYFVNTQYDELNVEDEILTTISEPPQGTFWMKSEKNEVKLKGCKHAFYRYFIRKTKQEKNLGNYKYEIQIEKLIKYYQNTLEFSKDSIQQFYLNKENHFSGNAVITAISFDMKQQCWAPSEYSEIVKNILPILKGSKSYVLSSYSNGNFIFIFGAPLKSNIVDIYVRVIQVYTIFLNLKQKVSSKYGNLKYGIGMDFGNVILSKYDDSNDNYIIEGSTQNRALELSTCFDGRVNITNSIYKNVNLKIQSFYKFDRQSHRYIGEVLHIKLDEWFNA